MIILGVLKPAAMQNFIRKYIFFPFFLIGKSSVFDRKKSLSENDGNM